jgi:hypothetical protein
MPLFRRILTAPLVFVAAIIILLEDWLWDDLQRIAAAIGSLPVFKQIESLVLRLPPAAALGLFIVPSLVLIPVKLLALYFISRGHAILGIVTIVGAKIAGTALVARLFTLTKPKLLTFRWFAYLYERITIFRSRIYTVIKSSAVYGVLHRLRENFRAWRQERRGWLRRRFKAARKLFRSRSDAVSDRQK